MRSGEIAGGEMIGAIRGILRDKGKSHLLLEIGALDVIVHVPASLLSSELAAGDRVHLYTHLLVREDDLSLYGFESVEQRDLYQMLLGVNGIGPRSALSLLSIFSTEVLAMAIAEGKPEVLARAPGVGLKTAQRVVLQLQDKMDARFTRESGGISDVDADVIAALTSLGYSLVEAQRAVQLLPADVTAVEERLSLALARFGSNR